MTPQEKITKLIDGYLDMLGDAQADVNHAYESEESKDYFAALQRQQALASAVLSASEAIANLNYLTTTGQ